MDFFSLVTELIKPFFLSPSERAEAADKNTIKAGKILSGTSWRKLLPPENMQVQYL